MRLGLVGSLCPVTDKPIPKLDFVQPCAPCGQACQVASCGVNTGLVGLLLFLKVGLYCTPILFLYSFCLLFIDLACAVLAAAGAFWVGQPGQAWTQPAEQQV